MENQFWVIEPLDSVWVSERWNLAGEHFPDAVQIVDRFHAEHTSRTCPSPSMARALTSKEAS